MLSNSCNFGELHYVIVAFRGVSSKLVIAIRSFMKLGTLLESVRHFILPYLSVNIPDIDMLNMPLTTTRTPT